MSRLLDAGADVVCLVRDWVPQSELISQGFIDRVKVAHGEVQDQGLMERVLGEYEIDTVFHLAAQTIVGIARRNPAVHLGCLLSTAPGPCWRPAAQPKGKADRHGLLG